MKAKHMHREASDQTQRDTNEQEKNGQNEQLAASVVERVQLHHWPIDTGRSAAARRAARKRIGSGRNVTWRRSKKAANPLSANIMRKMG
jgi:hypothetical protein